MTSKKAVVVDLIPNNYEEQPNLIEGNTKVYKEKVATKFDDLETVGKFLTIFQYVVVLATIIILVLSRIFKGTTVAFSQLKPSYSKFLEMQSDPDVLNMKCTVSNDTLTYNAFTSYAYEKADACIWVNSDLSKEGMTYTNAEYALYEHDGDTITSEVLPRSKLGLTSACKVLKKTSTCEAIKDNCNRGHELIENLFENMESSNFPLKELLDNDSKLLTFVNSTLQQSLGSLLSGLNGPRIAVQEWASKNMPALYGYFGSLHNYVQGQVFRLNEDSPTQFYKRVAAACTLYNEKFADDACDYTYIGDGMCDPECNNPYCLNDGGDCLRGIELYTSSHAFWDDSDSEYKFRGFSPLQQGDEVLYNPYYDITNTTTYDANMRAELKTLVELFDTNGDGTVSDEELDQHLSAEEDLEDLPIWQSLPNFFAGVDPDDTCGNPSTWYKAHEMDRPATWLTNLQATVKFVYNTCLRDTIFPQFGSPSGASRPSGDIPVQSKDVFSCDLLSKSHNLPGIEGFDAAQIKNWIDYTYALFDYFKEKCGSNDDGDWRTDCSANFDVTDKEGNELKNIRFPVAFLSDSSDTDIVTLLSRLEYAYLGSLARMNSGSVEQLLLDAGIKRDSKGYNVEAKVDYESYFIASDVSECTYSKKVGASPATVVTVVLGLIGGVTTTVSVFALFLYKIMRKRVFENYKNELK
jgi:hypothetical protein